MPSRVIPFATGEHYHVFNRGVDRMPIYKDTKNYKRFLKSMLYYQLEGPKPRFSLFSPNLTVLNTERKIVEIVSYCLMPNHFHFLLKQKRDGGITEFISKLSNSYTKYFNTKNKRVGPLLQGEFKAVYIETDEQLLHLSRYIHLNPVTSFVTEKLEDYIYSSYSEYIGTSKVGICEKGIILEQFPADNDYKKFVLDQREYAQALEIIKHQLLDYED